MSVKALSTCLMAIAVFSSCAFADVTFTGSSGLLSASVTFVVSNTTLKVSLVNTSVGDPVGPADILSAVLWDMTGNPELGKVSANSCPNCTIKYAPQQTTSYGASGGDVGGEWGYLAGDLGGGVTQHEGLSSMGAGNFGVGTRFNTTNLQDPDALDGIEYGIAPITDTTANDNGGLKGSSPQYLVVNQVDFVLSLPVGYSGTISNVRFQYGTAFDEPHFSAPEASSLTLLGFWLAVTSLAITFLAVRKTLAERHR